MSLPQTPRIYIHTCQICSMHLKTHRSQGLKNDQHKNYAHVCSKTLEMTKFAHLKTHATIMLNNGHAIVVAL